MIRWLISFSNQPFFINNKIFIYVYFANRILQTDIKTTFKGNCQACYPEFIEGYPSFFNPSSISSGRQ